MDQERQQEPTLRTTGDEAEGYFWGFPILPATTGKTVVSGGVLNGKAISKPQPAYPPIA
jgi:hypothetical protein